MATFQQQQLAADPLHEYRIASADYWCARIGRERPPDPSYRMVDGEQKLGRYMGPVECEVLMMESKAMWERWYVPFLINVGAGALIMGIDAFILLFMFPVFAVWYLAVRAKHQRLYDGYYTVMQKIIATGNPEWVPYNKDRLSVLTYDQRAIWP